uniref:Chitin synthase (EC) n=1 Tax=Ganoderma boninense TaxID=34458 RepID=A0A5K1K9E2_9APHY|nr:Chitin synthase (EC [Ganoderma boninense]
MRFPWVSVVSFLGFGFLSDSSSPHGVLGAALPGLPTAQTRTVSFRISRGPDSLPQHHIYVVNASVAGVPFEVIFDTGSSDLWIDTSGSEAALAKGQSVKTGRSIMLQYGVDGVHTYASGAVEYADVQLGAGLTAYNQSFVNVPGTTNITQYGDKGILGLGPPGGWSAIRETMKGTEWVSNPFLRTLLMQNPTMDPLFTVEYSSRDSEGMVNTGTLSFGDVSPPFVGIMDAPKLHLVTGQLWDVPSQGFMVNGEKVNFDGAGELPFVLDTGAYTACVPPEYMRAIYSSIPGSYLLDDGYWSVPCDAKLNVSMIIGNGTFPIHPIDMTEVYDVQDGTPLCKGLFRNNVDKRIPFLIGLNAMQNTYALFSYGDHQGSKPYVQLISKTDSEQAANEFDTMSFLERNATVVSQSTSLGNSQTSTQYRPSPLSTDLWSSGLPPTSTAPQIGRKRRLSTPEPDGEHEREHTPASKKFRVDSEADATPAPATPVLAPETETEEVKEVTEGVKEVELEEKPSAPEEVKDKEEEASSEAQEAAAVPLPDSPQLKATETEDADADGEADADADAEGEVDTKATAEVPSATEDEKVEEPLASSAAVDDEVPGLMLARKSPMKMETMQTAVLTAQA